MRLYILLFFLVLISCSTSKKKVTIEDLSMQLSELQNANAYSNTKLEELNITVNLLQEEVDSNKLILADLRKSVESRKKAVVMGNDLVEKQKEKVYKVSGPKSTFDNAFRMFKKRNYEGAINAFKNYIKAYPTYKNAADAHYWLGEIFFDKKQYDLALNEFNKIPERYPVSEKIDSAILKLGFCYLKLGDSKKAYSKFKEIVEIYPNSSSALIAKQEIEKLSN